MAALGLDDIWSLPKHKGNTVIDVILDDLKYVEWLIDNKKIFLDDEAFTLYEEEISKN